MRHRTVAARGSAQYSVKIRRIKKQGNRERTGDGEVGKRELSRIGNRMKKVPADRRIVTDETEEEIHPAPLDLAAIYSYSTDPSGNTLGVARFGRTLAASNRPVRSPLRLRNLRSTLSRFELLRRVPEEARAGGTARGR